MGDQGIYSDQSTYEEEEADIDEFEPESEEEYGHDSYREELAPEPPDSGYNINQHELCEEEDASPGYLIFKQPDNSRSSTKSTRSLTWSSSHKTSHTPESIVHFNSSEQSANKIQLYAFSGKRNYTEWERNMEEWFYYNRILKQHKLSYAIGQLKGEAYRGWLMVQDDLRLYKESPISTWEGLKKLLSDQYVPRDKNKGYTTTESLKMKTMEKKNFLSHETLCKPATKPEQSDDQIKAQISSCFDKLIPKLSTTCVMHLSCPKSVE